MMVAVNGNQEDLCAETISNVLSHYRLDPKKVVVEVNKQIISRADYPKTAVRQNDRIEIVEIVGGG